MKATILSALIAVALALSGPLAYALPGMYHDYDPKAFADAANSKRVLFFHANWCPTCRAADETLQKTPLPDDVMVYKVDYDTARDLKDQYGITSQHTFVLVDAKGNKVTQWTGLDAAMADHFAAPGEGTKTSDDKMMMNK